MSFDGFLFACKSAVKNFFKNTLLSIASVAVLCVCLILLSSTLLIVMNANMLVESIGNESEIVVFLEETLTADEIYEIKAKLEKIDNVINITYESPEQAYDNYIEENGDPGIAQGFDSSVFRPSYTMEMKDIDKYDQTVYEISKIEGIGTFSSGEQAGELAISSSKEFVDDVVRIKDVLMFLSVWIVLLFLIVALFIITNSVKLSVFSRRVEINIMKYVGATDFYIQLPYFIEGMIIGVIAGGMGFLIERYIYNAVLSPIIADLSSFAPIDIGPYSWLIFLLFMAAGLLVGIVGSVVPVKKYVNV